MSKIVQIYLVGRDCKPKYFALELRLQAYSRVRCTRTNQSRDTFVRPWPRTRSGHGHHHNWNRGHGRGHRKIWNSGHHRKNEHPFSENSRTRTWREQSADKRLRRILPYRVYLRVDPGIRVVGKGSWKDREVGKSSDLSQFFGLHVIVKDISNLKLSNFPIFPTALSSFSHTHCKH